MSYHLQYLIDGEHEARASVYGGSVEAAKAASESVLKRTGSDEGQLFYDPSGSTATDSGTLVATWKQAEGWADGAARS